MELESMRRRVEKPSMNEKIKKQTREAGSRDIKSIGSCRK